MAKLRPVIIDTDTMTAMAGLATIVAGNIIRRLHSRGILTDGDVDQIIEDTASGGLGDPTLDKMAKAMADSMRTAFNTGMN